MRRFGRTLATIKDKLFYTFACNIVAMPLDAVGPLSPVIACGGRGVLQDLLDVLGVGGGQVFEGGVLGEERRCGLFTLASVVWADNAVAINSSNGFSKSSSQ